MNRRILALAVLFLAVGMLPLAAIPKKASPSAASSASPTSASPPISRWASGDHPGIGYPGGLWFLGEMLDVFNLPFVTEPGRRSRWNVTYPVSIGERFDLKLGANIWIIAGY